MSIKSPDQETNSYQAKAESFVQFGFEQIPTALKTQKIKNIFQRVSSHYDLMNDVMSLGAHRLWKQWFVESLPITPNMHIIDVAGGTGDITKEIVKTFPSDNLTITICDLTYDMLQQGRDKFLNEGIFKSINWLTGNAENLPFQEQSLDLYVISFGFRNVSDRDAALQEAKRILKPGCKFVCMEFSQIQNATLAGLYDQYAFKLIPFLGDKIAHDEAAYEYLAQSIKTFPNQETFKELIEKNGFHNVTYTNYFNGLVAVHCGTA